MMATRSQTCCTSLSKWLERNTVLPWSAARLRIRAAHLLNAGDVEAVDRLVENDDFGIIEQGRGDAEPLAHAGGIGLHLAPRVLRETDLLEQGIDPLGAGAVGLGEHLQIPAAGEEGIEGAAIDQRADPAQHGVVGGEIAIRTARPGPRVGAIRPISMRIVVLLPAPLGPRKP